MKLDIGIISVVWEGYLNKNLIQIEQERETDI